MDGDVWQRRRRTPCGRGICRSEIEGVAALAATLHIRLYFALLLLFLFLFLFLFLVVIVVVVIFLLLAVVLRLVAVFAAFGVLAFACFVLVIGSTFLKWEKTNDSMSRSNSRQVYQTIDDKYHFRSIGT